MERPGAAMSGTGVEYRSGSGRGVRGRSAPVAGGRWLNQLEMVVAPLLCTMAGGCNALIFEKNRIL
jgi:hypothetical protein